MAGNLPSLEDLQKYNVNRPGDMEGARASLYDFQTYANAVAVGMLGAKILPRGNAQPAPMLSEYVNSGMGEYVRSGMGEVGNEIY